MFRSELREYVESCTRQRWPSMESDGRGQGDLQLEQSKYTRTIRLSFWRSSAFEKAFPVESKRGCKSVAKGCQANGGERERRRQPGT